MIEALIQYFQDKGFQTHVIPGVLLIRKQIGEQTCGVDWAISKTELAQAPKEALFARADAYISMIEQAIEQRASG